MIANHNNFSYSVQFSSCHISKSRISCSLFTTVFTVSLQLNFASDELTSRSDGNPPCRKARVCTHIYTSPN